MLIRRILYSFILQYPEFVTHCFTMKMPKYKRWLVRILYPFLRRGIYKKFVLNAEEVNKSRKQFREAMETLRHRLGQREYFIGDTLSRADMSIAAMLSILLRPEEHPHRWPAHPIPEMDNFYSEYQEHPIFIWALSIYRKHRVSTSHSHIIKKND